METPFEVELQVGTVKKAVKFTEASSGEVVLVSPDEEVPSGATLF